MNKGTYNTPELLIMTMMDDLIRTSEQSAPDVFEKDPFIEG